MSSIRRDPPGSLPDPATDPYRSTALTPLDELIDRTPTPAQLDARRMADAHSSRRCHYLKPSGERCGSPAMRGFDLCYYHDRYQPKSGYRNLPCLEDPHSVQCAIQEIIEEMLNGLLDYKKAALALYGLQTAASNLKQMRIADEQRARQEEACTVEQEACTVDRASCTEEKEACTVDRVPWTEESRATTDDRSLTQSAYDELEEVEMIAAAETQPSSASIASSWVHSPTTLLESPRPPQHVTRGLRTQAERQAMAQRFPDLKKIRAEVLASLTPEERARVEARSPACTPAHTGSLEHI